MCKAECVFAKTRERNEDMTTNHKLISAVLVGVSVGVYGANAVHAHQVKAPPAYLISEADEMDIAAIQKYGEKVPETLAPFKGQYHFLVGGGAKTQPLDGVPPKGIVVIAFDSTEMAREWYDSPAYQAIKPIRLSSTKGRMFIVEGAGP
jgi:uncharacterized protein (DUF1330 family)